MLKSLYLYSRYFAGTVFSARISYLLTDTRRYILSRNPYFKDKDISPSGKKYALARAIAWLLHAQSSSPDDGMGSFHLVNKWSASYPETTGYIIPSLLQFAERNNDSNIRKRAVKAADWLLQIQKPSGGWQGGRVNEDRAEVVFNTAQIIRGLLAVYKLSKDIRYLDAARKAGDWLCEIQNADGTWTRFALMGKERVYDSYVDYPLLMLHRITTMEKFRVAAVKNLEWIVNNKQNANGWFEDCDNTEKNNDRPILHTIAYTIDGLLDSGIYLKEKRYIDAALKASAKLREMFDRDGYLHGRYDRDWKGSEHMILTGCAQMSIVWSKIAHYSGNNNYAVTAARMNCLLVNIQNRGFRKEGPNTAGALNGSYPLWGRYEPFAFPNWATKYLADALMLEEDHRKQ
ncbi:MAG TPA: prenyltransferase/squalene oxidase repeat-containing protein [Bacteroidales bacterium]|nr:prenyltransferase/squalene oxidase repeat-containing protein [Bacteroidales bacterium]